MWIIGSILGSISLVILNVMSKLVTLSVTNVILLGSLSLLTTAFFVYAFRMSEHFLVCWFFNSLLVAIGAFIANHYFIQHRVTPYHIVGIILLLFGAILLRK